MKAIGILDETSGIDDLQFIETEKVNPKEDEVMVEVHRLGLNPSDYRMCSPGPIPRKFPFIFGSDIVGMVVAVGKNVQRFQVGDVVYGKEQIPNFGGCQEFVTINQEFLVKKPERISMSQAATIPVTFQTAYMNLIKKGKLQANQKVLVLGGAGGVGSTAVQIAKEKGAVVYCTVLTHEVNRAKSIGADVVIDALTDDFTKMNDKMDLVMDTLGVKFQAEAYKVMREGATLVSCAADPDQALAGQYNVKAEPFEFAHGNMVELSLANEMIEKGVYHPMFAEEIDFNPKTISEALNRIKNGEHRGRIVVKIKD